MNILERIISAISPSWGYSRARRHAAISALRSYDAASTGPRTENWRREYGDANSTTRGDLIKLRADARDLVRNNPYGRSALRSIVSGTIGWGIVPADSPQWFERWSNTTSCDRRRRRTLWGLQRQVLRALVTDGEVIVVRKRGGLQGPIPLSLLVLEADHLDTSKEGPTPGGGRIVQGVEVDSDDAVVAYWLFPQHPGAPWSGMARSIGTSVRHLAADVLHIYDDERPGQLRGVSWFAPVLVTANDGDLYEHASLLKQQVAACLAVIFTNVTGDPLGSVNADTPTIDRMTPGMMKNAPPGYDAKFPNPPSVREYPDYMRSILRKIAKGMGVTYEQLTGDFSQVNFSSARMARLEFVAQVEQWRWDIIVPQFCERVWQWAREAADLVALSLPESTEWTAPGIPWIEPDKEGRAASANVRAGITTLSEVARERGYTLKKLLSERKRDDELLDKLGIVLDSDPRKMTQAGTMHGAAQTGTEPPAPEDDGDEEEPTEEKPKVVEPDDSDEDGDEEA